MRKIYHTVFATMTFGLFIRVALFSRPTWVTWFLAFLFALQMYYVIRAYRKTPPVVEPINPNTNKGIFPWEDGFSIEDLPLIEYALKCPVLNADDARKNNAALRPLANTKVTESWQVVYVKKAKEKIEINNIKIQTQ